MVQFVSVSKHADQQCSNWPPCFIVMLHSSECGKALAIYRVKGQGLTNKLQCPENTSPNPLTSCRARLHINNQQTTLFFLPERRRTAVRGQWKQTAHRRNRSLCFGFFWVSGTLTEFPVKLPFNCGASTIPRILVSI